MVIETMCRTRSLHRTPARWGFSARAGYRVGWFHLLHALRWALMISLGVPKKMEVGDTAPRLAIAW